jgi:hypothetical protein
MASLSITNISASAFFLNDVYVDIAAAQTLVVSRSPAEISSMAGLQAAVADGVLTASIAYTADELASIPLPSPIAPGSVSALAVAPVAAAAIDSAPVIFRKAFASGGAPGTADDVTIYAVNTLPYKVRILNAFASISTAVGGSGLTIRSAAGGAGTLAATISSAATGVNPVMSLGAGDASVVLTPGASVGLFVRRSDRSVTGEIVITARREA